MKAKFRVERCSQLGSQSLFSVVVAKPATYLLSGFSQERQKVGELGQASSETPCLFPASWERSVRTPTQKPFGDRTVLNNQKANLYLHTLLYMGRTKSIFHQGVVHSY